MLDGTENWTLAATYSNNVRFITSNYIAEKTGDIKSSHFVKGQGGTDTTNIDVNGSTGYIMITISKEFATTIEELKAYLAQQYVNGTPVTIEFESQDEEIEAYTEEQQQIYNKIQELHSYYGTTIITCEDEVSCIFDIEYVQDSKLVRQNDKQELQTQIDEIKQAVVALGGV